MKSIIPLAALLAIACHALAQQPDAEGKITVSPFTGQLMVSTDFKESMYLNIIGTGLRYTRNNTIISVTIFPSLSFHEDRPVDPADKKKPFVRPGFALGPLVQYKRFMVGLPAFYQDDEWHLTFGVGVKIGK